MQINNDDADNGDDDEIGSIMLLGGSCSTDCTVDNADNVI